MTDLGFMMMVTSLVFFMTPGLALFYGGFDSKKNVVNLIFQSYCAIGLVTILWFLGAYSLAFSGDNYGFIGDLNKAMLLGVSPDSLFAGTKLPEMLFFCFQLMFAIITPALMTGAFTHRMSTPAYLLFVPLWLVVVYLPLAHMVWGGGALAQWGVLDFAGGIVVHCSAGFGALAAVIYIGKRHDMTVVSHNVPFIALGTGMLWFGWFGFNAGSALAADGIAVLAFLNTQLAAAVGGFTWFHLDWWFSKKRKLVPFCVGSISGLATITPCAGFVTPVAALLIGFGAGVMCYLLVAFKNKKGWDDALDVWPVHGMGGFLGTVLLGVFATTTVNSSGANGLLYGGGGEFFYKQVLAAVGCSAYSFVVSYMLLKLVNVFVPVRVDQQVEVKGIDRHHHGENAYQS